VSPPAAGAGLSALLVDLEGTVYEAGRLLPGAAEALARAEAHGVPHRFVTNTTRPAAHVGKPSPSFFAAALSSLGVSASAAAVVGDDLESDVGGAQAAGMRGILVRTGKFRAEELARAAGSPDAVIDSLAELPALLL
jgi:ribonucleotide monophosphatase NagD (HAD superfamily)